jgi:hypothetical protein
VTKKKVEIDPTTGKEKVLETKTESIKAPDAAPADPAKPGTTPAKPGGTTPAKPGTTPAPAGGGAAKPTTPAPVTAPKPAEKK